MFNGKAFWADEDGEVPTPMSADEKAKFLSLFERQDALKSVTRGLTARPGNCKKPVTFLSYYEGNWESCSFRWVWACRKNLPTKSTICPFRIESPDRIESETPKRSDV